MTSPEALRVELGARSYDIFIGDGLLDRLGELLAPLGLGRHGVLITDSNVEPLYAPRVTAALLTAGYQVRTLSVPAGEESKSLTQATRLLKKLPGYHLDRQSFVVALGGGVVGDLAGFIAATYLRGLAFVQVPTTLLAQVDSSVGGKVGVNLPQGKNLVGAFHQPRLVVADPGTLGTLSERELRSGYAEVIKSAAIRDTEFCTWLEREGARVLGRDLAAVSTAVHRCCTIKAAVVAADEREGGLRAILNFGHTVGHAMETLMDYAGLLHGEAVGMGMTCAARLSVRRAGLDPAAADRLLALIAAAGLSTRVADQFEPATLLQAMRLDKKARAGQLRFILLPRLGEAVVSEAVTDTDVEEVLRECR